MRKINLKMDPFSVFSHYFVFIMTIMYVILLIYTLIIPKLNYIFDSWKGISFLVIMIGFMDSIIFKWELYNIEKSNSSSVVK